MKLIKLNAIDSTNEYIKLNKSFFSQNSLAVYSFNQTNGKGQRGKKWITEPYKNTCISFYYGVDKPSEYTLLKINLCTTLTVLEVLKSYDITDLKIKWPNDIMSGNRKIAGILIETTVLKNKINDLIIGIGLNVNQTDFDVIKEATSMKILKNKSFNLHMISKQFVEKFSSFDDKISNISKDKLIEKFCSHLFGIREKKKFAIGEKVVEGKILGITDNYMLSVELDNQVKHYDKEQIKLIL